MDAAGGSETGRRRISVESSSGDYPVWIGPGLLNEAAGLLLEHAPAARYAVISDETVEGLHGETLRAGLADKGLDHEVFGFPAGEASKNRKTWSILTDKLLDSGFGRDTTIVTLGGGVTGDLGGFVAATYLRGVPVVHFPTSYLAMIDASVGGKTGVDVRAGKNLVGAFHPPRLVAADLDVLGTLPGSERVEGLVEAFKHGAVTDAAYFESLEGRVSELRAAEAGAAAWAVGRSVEIKADIVSRDEHESGLRQVLNFGHTLGHALEAASDFAVGHGTAVGAGMLLEARLGERIGLTVAGTAERIEQGLAGLDLDFSLLQSLDQDHVMGYLATDKKARARRPRYVLLERLGRVAESDGWSHDVPDTLVDEILGDWR